MGDRSEEGSTIDKGARGAKETIEQGIGCTGRGVAVYWFSTKLDSTSVLSYSVAQDKRSKWAVTLLFTASPDH